MREQMTGGRGGGKCGEGGAEERRYWRGIYIAHAQPISDAQ